MGLYSEKGRICGGLIFGILIGLHTWGRIFRVGVWGGGLFMGGVLTGFYGTFFKNHCFKIYPKEKLQDH